MDASYISLGDIYDLHCQETGIAREEPVLVSGDKTKKVLREMRLANMKVGHCMRCLCNKLTVYVAL